MRYSILALSTLYFLQSWGQSAAKVVPITGRVRTGQSQKLSRRIIGSAALSDDQDVQYLTNITLGGQSVQVSIDTGRYVGIQ
jgi:hypothetical protein